MEILLPMYEITVFLSRNCLEDWEMDLAIKSRLSGRMLIRTVEMDRMKSSILMKFSTVLSSGVEQREDGGSIHLTGAACFRSVGVSFRLGHLKENAGWLLPQFLQRGVWEGQAVCLWLPAQLGHMTFFIVHSLAEWPSE